MNTSVVQASAPSTALAIAPQYEVAVSAAAAAAKATVSARYEMALRKPRSWDDVRVNVLKECRRPSFAHDKSAWYKKPIGQGVEGLGIRFAEMALRCMGNVLIETEVRYEDDMKEVIRVTVTDLEANNTWPLDITVRKTIERSKPSDDGTYLSVRMNSYNKPVYTVPAGDDDLLNKRGALVSKAVRTLALRIIPGDIQNEAEDTIKAIRLARAAQDPDAERKAVVDAFAELRVMPNHLVEYLGHPIDQCSPAQLVDLRGLFSSIRDGETTWHKVMDNKREQDGVAAPEKAEPPSKAGPPTTKAAEPPKTSEPPKAAEQPAAKAPENDPPWEDDPPPAAPAASATQEPDAASPGEKQNLKQRVAAKGVDMRMLLDTIGATDVPDATLNGLTKEQFKAAKARLA